MNTIDLTPLVQAIISLAVVIITTFLIPFIKSKVDKDKLEKIQTWVTVAVEAAEQIYVGSGKGAEKKKYVLEFLKSKGFTLDMDSIDNLIEAAVLRLKNE